MCAGRTGWHKFICVFKLQNLLMKHTLLRRLKFWVIIFVMAATAGTTRAQYITIPDANFLAWLNAHGFSNCITGNQMDTLCADTVVILSDTLDISNQGISDFTGIKHVHFYGGGYPVINLSHNDLTWIQPELCEKIQLPIAFDFSYNHITELNFDSIMYYGGAPYALDLGHNEVDTIVANVNPNTMVEL